MAPLSGLGLDDTAGVGGPACHPPPPPERSEAVKGLIVLLERVARGEQAAMSALRAATFAKLLSTVSPIIRDGHECEDVLQEVYLTIWRCASAYNPGAHSPISWICTIARNRAIDRWRSRTLARRTVVLDAAMQIADPDPLAIDRLEMRERWRQVAVCLDRLDDRSCGAVRMTLVDGLSYKVAAMHFDVPESTMKSIVRRALINVRSQLSL